MGDFGGADRRCGNESDDETLRCGKKGQRKLTGHGRLLGKKICGNEVRT
jgi:hypothetical protein